MPDVLVALFSFNFVISLFTSSGLQYMGIETLAQPGFLIGGGPNHKSHAMTSSEIFEKGTFCGAKISQNERSEAVA